MSGMEMILESGVGEVDGHLEKKSEEERCVMMLSHIYPEARGEDF